MDLCHSLGRTLNAAELDRTRPLGTPVAAAAGSCSDHTSLAEDETVARSRAESDAQFADHNLRVAEEAIDSLDIVDRYSHRFPAAVGTMDRILVLAERDIRRSDRSFLVLTFSIIY